MPTYDADFDALSDNNSHSLMVRLVGPDKRVLDVGCATGYLGEALIARGCRVSGVEIDPESASRAAKLLDEVVVADLAQVDLVAHFGAASFDVVVLGDILEHLTDPDRLLRHVTRLLAPGGSVVISTPNVTHGSLRLALLQGRWRYTDTRSARPDARHILRPPGSARPDRGGGPRRDGRPTHHGGPARGRGRRRLAGAAAGCHRLGARAARRPHLPVRHPGRRRRRRRRPAGHAHPDRPARVRAARRRPGRASSRPGPSRSTTSSPRRSPAPVRRSRSWARCTPR